MFKMIRNGIDGRFKIVKSDNENGTAFADSETVQGALEHFLSIWGDMGADVDLSEVEYFMETATINEENFLQWLQFAWESQSDGWDRAYWCNYETGKVWTTTETKSTSYENADEVVCIGFVSGDNNADYNAICEDCSAYNCDCCNNCEEWNEEEANNYNGDFKQMQFACMENVGWVDDFKAETQKRLNQSRYFAGLEPVYIKYV